MKLVTRALRFERDILHHLHLRDARAIPKLRRLFHPKTLHHAHRVCLGVAVMLVGVVIAKTEVASHAAHLMLDVIGYSIHGLGLIPIAKHVEPLWEVLAD